MDPPVAMLKFSGTASWFGCRFRDHGIVEQTTQVNDVVLKSFPSFPRNGDPGAGLAARKILVNVDVAGCFQCPDMGAEIAVRGVKDATQPGKLDRLSHGQGVKGRHDSQAGGLVDDLVWRVHGHACRNHIPPRVKPPPPTTAIQSRKIPGNAK